MYFWKNWHLLRLEPHDMCCLCSHYIHLNLPIARSNTVSEAAGRIVLPPSRNITWYMYIYIYIYVHTHHHIYIYILIINLIVDGWTPSFSAQIPISIFFMVVDISIVTFNNTSMFLHKIIIRLVITICAYGVSESSLVQQEDPKR